MVAIDEVGSTLNDLQVDPVVIAEILSVLDLGVVDLGRDWVGEVPGGAFGPGADAIDLGENTAKAREHVQRAMDDMVIGLRGFRKNLHDYAKRALVVDEGAAAQLQSYQQAIESLDSCVATPDFASPSACTPADGGAGA